MSMSEKKFKVGDRVKLAEKCDVLAGIPAREAGKHGTVVEHNEVRLDDGDTWAFGGCEEVLLSLVVADPCAVCGAEACDYGERKTAQHHGQKWRLCERHWNSSSHKNYDAIYERHIKPKGQGRPSCARCGAPRAMAICGLCADCDLLEREPVAEQPKVDQYTKHRLYEETLSVAVVDHYAGNQVARARNIAALKAELSRPFEPRFPSVGRDSRVFGERRWGEK
jgi:hypothetical protein